VHSLGKSALGRPASGWEKLVSRFIYASRFLKLIWKLRNDYDAVFVHMNQEYVLIGGLVWRLLGKQIFLWRNHLRGSISTGIAARLSKTVFCTSSRAFVAKYKNAVLMPIGIDVAKFSSKADSAPPESILFLGRLDAVKRPGDFIDALRLLANKKVVFHADIYGSPTVADSEFVKTLKESGASLVESGMLEFHPGLHSDLTPSVYSSHLAYVNLTPSGSFDKTVGEAMAAGCIVVAANDAVADILGPELYVRDYSVENVSSAIEVALSMSQEEVKTRKAAFRDYIQKEHSLDLLITNLVNAINAA
jgi:glycosyltransferase involved in cell wall biosynthesis